MKGSRKKPPPIVLNQRSDRTTERLACALAFDALDSSEQYKLRRKARELLELLVKVRP